MTHKQSGHKSNLDQATPLESPAASIPPPGIPASAMPSAEFMETVQRIESQEPGEASKPSQHPSELPKAEPIRLTYMWSGECPEHRRPINTLELDIDKKHFCIAYCATGNHQLEVKEVAKL